MLRYKISSGKKKPFKEYQGILGVKYTITNIKNKINFTVSWTQLNCSLENGKVRGQLKNIQTKKEKEKYDEKSRKEYKTHM